MSTLRMEQKNTIAANRRFAGLLNSQRPAIRRMAASAFTLTELLVVIAIIAVLASLITAAAVNAMRRSREASITTEIKQLASAAERFKDQLGGAYPPNAMNFNSVVSIPNNYKNQPIADLVINDFIRSFRKAFPRHKEPEGLLRRLAGQIGNIQNDTSSADELDGGMNAAEAIYFWLGGFSSDPAFPISGPGGPSFGDGDDANTTLELSDEILENRNFLYEFDLTRLGPRNDDGIFHDDDNGGVGRFVRYQVNLNGDTDLTDPGETRRINLWTYHPEGSESSFLYFDASRHDPVTYDRDLSGVADLKIFALKKLREGFSAAGVPAPRDLDFVSKGKYQILHPGLDDIWGDLSSFSIENSTGQWDTGDASAVLLFPTGPFTGDLADTLTSFTDGTLESEQE